MSIRSLFSPYYTVEVSMSKIILSKCPGCHGKVLFSPSGTNYENVSGVHCSKCGDSMVIAQTTGTTNAQQVHIATIWNAWAAAS